MVIAAAFAGAYYLWSQRSGTGPRVSPQETAPPKEAPAAIKITLYFPDDQEEYLLEEYREIPQSPDASALAKAVVDALIAGPRSGLQPAIPQGTRLRKVSLGEQGLCTVDLNEAFQKNHPGGTSGELMTVYSIVESLAANVPGIRSVQILVEGQPRETLAGHLYIGEPLAPDARYIRRKQPKKT
jgi:germination protein M